MIGVVGSRGGAGASTLAPSLAASLTRSGATCAVVDLSRGGGLDVLLGIEADPGLRWPDLAQARGAVDGDEVVAVLPRWRDVTVLSTDRLRQQSTEPDVVQGVLAALGRVHDVVVLDLDRSGVLDGGLEEVVQGCALLLLLAPLDLRSAAGAVALRGALGSRTGTSARPDVRLVVRGPAPGGLAAVELAHVLGLPVEGSLPYRRRLDAAIEAGAGPPRRGAYTRAVDRLARDLS